MNDDSQAWIHGYLDGTLTDAEFAAFSAWLRDDPRNARRFADAALLHNRLAELHQGPVAIRPPSVPMAEIVGEAIAEISDSKQRSVETREPIAIGLPAITSTVTAPIVTSPIVTSPIDTVRRVHGRTVRRWMIAGGTLALSAIVVAALALFQHSTGTVSAATRELTRVITAQSRSPWRSYQIVVESERSLPVRGDRRRDVDGRPPKPLLNEAKLYVGPDGRFVLIGGKLAGGWIAGSNGGQSWSVRGTEPVLVSDDPLHFRRDVPGHEHAMPLNDLEAMLQRLSESYEVVVLDDSEDAEYIDEKAGGSDAADSEAVSPRQGAELPIGSKSVAPTNKPSAEKPSGPTASSNGSSRRLLVATKRRGQRGPRQVEVAYDAATDQLFAIRFVDMPYGANRLTLRLEPLPSMPAARQARFFEHSAHHSPDRPVERLPGGL
ncbi:MAG: anti-sigma factor family protein [Planctomycetota bacterium]